MLRRVLEGIVQVAVPVALLVALGADLWVGLAFGRAFAPAAMSLRMLAPLFVLIYVSILLATALVVQGRGWTLTMIAVAGICTQRRLGAAPGCRRSGRWLGAGGAGAGMALAGVVKEIVVVCCMLAANGVETIDRARWMMIGRTALAAGATVALHAGPGAARPLASPGRRLRLPAVGGGLWCFAPGRGGLAGARDHLRAGATSGLTALRLDRRGAGHVGELSQPGLASEERGRDRHAGVLENGPDPVGPVVPE